MDPHELKPDDYGKYRAYYLGQLVDLINFDPASTSVTVPTSPGRFEAVSWSDLDKFDPPHVEILRFEVNPAVGYFDSTFEAVWETMGASRTTLSTGFNNSTRALYGDRGAFKFTLPYLDKPDRGFPPLDLGNLKGWWNGVHGDWVHQYAHQGDLISAKWKVRIYLGASSIVDFIAQRSVAIVVKYPRPHKKRL